MKLRIFIFMLFLHVNMFSSDIHVKLLEHLLDIEYRQDGTTDLDGKFTTFSNKSKFFKKAKFNCSGFVHTASKILLNKNISIDDAKKDINNNSQKNSKMGEDWDFGRDLILNIASGYSYRFLNPTKIDENSNTSDGIKTDDLKAWNEIFEQIKEQNIYLIAFSKPTDIKGYKYLYYHVGIIIKDSNKNIWLYHATPKLGVHRVWLDYDRNMTPFQKEFLKNPKYDKKVIILEINLEK